MSVTFAVLLWPVPGREAELHAYEDDVFRLLDDHGGRVNALTERLAHPTSTRLMSRERAS